MINSCFYRYVARKYNYYKCVSLIFFERLRPVRSRKGHMTKSKQSSECFKVTAETKRSVCHGWKTVKGQEQPITPVLTFKVTGPFQSCLLGCVFVRTCGLKAK